MEFMEETAGTATRVKCFKLFADNALSEIIDSAAFSARREQSTETDELMREIHHDMSGGCMANVRLSVPQLCVIEESLRRLEKDISADIEKAEQKYGIDAWEVQRLVGKSLHARRLHGQTVSLLSSARDYCVYALTDDPPERIME